MTKEYVPDILSHTRSASRVRRNDTASAFYLYYKATGELDSDEFREQWSPAYATEHKLADYFDFIPNKGQIDIQQFPEGTFLIQFDFKLRKPFLSKDDNDFYIIENPIAREKVFRRPMVKASSWKGGLKSAIRFLRGIQKIGEDDDQIRHIFGEALEEDEGGRAGRGHFFPTFFENSKLHLINPHDREHGAGTQPVLMEVVPEGEDGVFTLLYIPWPGNRGRPPGISEVFQDLLLLARGIEALFTWHGFGAKTSSGFGVADLATIESDMNHLADIVMPGTLLLHYSLPEELQQESLEGKQEIILPFELKKILERWPDEDFKSSPKRWQRDQKASKQEKSWYTQARGQFQEFKDIIEQQRMMQKSQDEESPPAGNVITEFNFSSFEELITFAEQLTGEAHD